MSTAVRELSQLLHYYYGEDPHRVKDRDIYPRPQAPDEKCCLQKAYDTCNMEQKTRYAVATHRSNLPLARHPYLTRIDDAMAAYNRLCDNTASSDRRHKPKDRASSVELAISILPQRYFFFPQGASLATEKGWNIGDRLFLQGQEPPSEFGMYYDIPRNDFNLIHCVLYDDVDWLARKLSNVLLNPERQSGKCGGHGIHPCIPCFMDRIVGLRNRISGQEPDTLSKGYHQTKRIRVLQPMGGPKLRHLMWQGVIGPYPISSDPTAWRDPTYIRPKTKKKTTKRRKKLDCVTPAQFRRQMKELDELG
jgi:hypothetical protein